MDRNYQSLRNSLGEHLTPERWVPPELPAAFDDILKFSNCSKTMVEGLSLRSDSSAPQENWIDCVRGDGYMFGDCKIGAAGVAGATIKGAIDGWTFLFCAFDKCAKYEVEVGQFDDYWRPGRKPTRHGYLSRCTRSDGGKVRVICWDADEPLHDSATVEVRKVPWVVWFPYFLFRFCCVRINRLFRSRK